MSVWAGHAHWQSTTRWKYAGSPVSVAFMPWLDWPPNEYLEMER